MKLVPDSKTRLIATVQPGKTVTIHYRPHTRFPQPFNNDPGTPYQANTQLLSLCLEIDGKVVWKYETGTSPPSLLQLKEGESVKQAPGPLDEIASRLFAEAMQYRLDSRLHRSRAGDGDVNNACPASTKNPAADQRAAVKPNQLGYGRKPSCRKAYNRLPHLRRGIK